MTHLKTVVPSQPNPIESWIETVSGGRVDFLSPSPKEIKIEDIAWGLSRIPRFAGHTGDRIPLSVSVHSIWVAMYLVKRTDSYLSGLHGLLADAHKAFIGDIPDGLRCLPSMRDEFAAVEQRLKGAIYKALDLDPPNNYQLGLLAEAEGQAMRSEVQMHLRSGGMKFKNLVDEDIAAACLGPSSPQIPRRGYERYMTTWRILNAKLKQLH